MAVRSARCPLCERTAQVPDWSPGEDWKTIEGCACRPNGFLVEAGVWSTLPGRTPLVRQRLSDRLRAYPAEALVRLRSDPTQREGLVLEALPL